MPRSISVDELLLTRCAIGLTLLAASAAGYDYFCVAAAASSSWLHTAEVSGFALVAAALLYGNVVYQLARFGYWRRRLDSMPSLQPGAGGDAASVVILIPSYREEVHVLSQTIVSAALAQYTDRRVVVLLDDPPAGSPAQLAALDAAHRMIDDLDARFAVCAARIEARVMEVDRLTKSACKILGLAAVYDEAAGLLDDWARVAEDNIKPTLAHVDRLFVDKVLREPAAGHRRRAEELRACGFDDRRYSAERARLRALFRVAIGRFERKRYANLPHTPNKAMNLNAYIGLMGHCFRTLPTANGMARLKECAPQEADLVVPAAEFVLTLDADSLISADYLLRLVPILQNDPRLAVVQTPYAAFPGAPGQLERVAGATTDIQRLIHQGSTHFDATYWVGANALIRFRALHDIATTVEERGHRVPVFIQDKTVIEDTGSTVDLIRRGWRLYNHPERLAYSATPPDFGSLIIQRRRWSNGGLIILADLWRYGRKCRRGRRAIFELTMRTNYLVSPALSNLALLALLFFPFPSDIISLWLPLSAAPYYYLYGRDLTQSGYRWADLPRVYALNLLLMPVNLAGVLRSVGQIATGRKAAFGRTPKIEGRTTTPLLHIALQLAIFACLCVGCTVDLSAGRWLHATYAMINAGFWYYGLAVLIGWRAIRDDLRAGVSAAFTAIPRRRRVNLRAPARLDAPAGGSD